MHFFSKLILSLKGTSMVRDGGGFNSPHSDGSEFEHAGKLNLSTPRNFPSRRSFMSKPIHPLSFPVHSFTREASASPAVGLSSYDAITPQRDSHRLSSGSGSGSSSLDLTDISDRLEPEFNANEGFKCGLCDRLLSQRSPWSSRRIVKTEDMPVAGVLSCRHVFHAECLDQTTPKSHKSDPLCPICSKLERESSPEQPSIFPRLRNNFPRLRTFSEEGSSRTWGCVQASDCVTPQKSSIQKIKKSLSNKGNSGKLKKTSSHPLHLFGGRFSDHGTGGCSKTAAGPSIKKG